MRVASSLKNSEARKNIDQSGLVNSGQTGIHPHLEKIVHRHLQTKWSQPMHHPSIDAYRQLEDEAVLSGPMPIILDSGCGTGESTRQLAVLYPGHLVIGVDRSKIRLEKSGVCSGFSRSGNCILLRAELATFWRLLLNDGYAIERHFLFYPNPWPKARHVLRRWHGHPVFPYMLALGGEIEMRCNWETYALEFAEAVKIATGASTGVKKIAPGHGISPFEKKYLERSQILFNVIVPARVTRAFRLDW
jgi:tRNA G46 methylase TrmB